MHHNEANFSFLGTLRGFSKYLVPAQMDKGKESVQQEDCAGSGLGT